MRNKNCKRVLKRNDFLKTIKRFRQQDDVAIVEQEGRDIVLDSYIKRNRRFPAA